MADSFIIDSRLHRCVNEMLLPTLSMAIEVYSCGKASFWLDVDQLIVRPANPTQFR